LQNDGKLKIEDKLDLYLPDFAPAGKIMLWHLLGHESGLADPDYDAIAARSVSPDELLGMIAAKPLLFEPGSNSRYSNAGYIVLARVIEKISGVPFGDFLAQRIFGPLSMTGTGTLESGEIVPKLAEGYIPAVGTELMKPQPRDPSSLYGSGNVYSTAGDLDRWLTAIDEHELFDITKQPYPFGWGKRTWFDKYVLVQSGITNGYSSIILTVPDEALHIIVLTNVQSGFTGDEGKSLLGIAEGQAATPPARRAAPASVARATLEGYAGLYEWGDAEIPMHIETDGRTLRLRWADSTSITPLTPLSNVDFLDRTSFGTIHFQDGGLVWTQNGETTNAPRAHE
jgi:CubicO group peptidase (beta-lactamase class C family)